MAKKLFSVVLLALLAGLFVVACDDGGGDDTTGPIDLPDPNVAPEISGATASALLANDTLWTGTDFSLDLLVTDEETASLIFEVTGTPTPALTITGGQMSWTPTVDDTGAYSATLTVTDSGGLTDEFSWSFVVAQAEDKSFSLPKFEVTLENSTGAIHPALEGKPFVGLLYSGDGTLLETKTWASVDSDFVMVMDTEVDTGTAITMDYFFDSDGDEEFDPPTDPTARWTDWPELAGRWEIDSVARDPFGEMGVPVNMTTLNSNKTDISDLIQ